MRGKYSTNYRYTNIKYIYQNFIWNIDLNPQHFKIKDSEHRITVAIHTIITEKHFVQEQIVLNSLAK